MQWTGTIWTTLKEDQPRIIPVKFGQNPICGLGGDVVWRNCLWTHACTDGRTDARRTKCDHKSSPCHYVTGELKKAGWTTMARSQTAIVRWVNGNPFRLVLAQACLSKYGAQRGKKALMPCANSEGPTVRAHPCSLIWTFPVRRHILQYLLILSASNEGPDQPARMRRLIRACVARKLHKGPFRSLRFERQTILNIDVFCHAFIIFEQVLCCCKKENKNDVHGFQLMTRLTPPCHIWSFSSILETEDFGIIKMDTGINTNWRFLIKHLVITLLWKRKLAAWLIITKTYLYNFDPLKGPIVLKKTHFIIQERFRKLKYNINSIIKCGSWQPVKFQFLTWIKNEMIFYHISELMLPTLVQRFDKKIISFLIHFKNESLNEILQAVRCHFLWLY